MNKELLKDRIDYSKKLCKEMENNHGEFILDLINDLEAINYTRCYTTCKPILEDRLVKIKTEPDGIVRETMIDNLLIGLDDL